MKLFLLAPAWAFWGMVSCDDPGAVEARVRAEVRDPDAIVHCQEPRAWRGEKNWVCTADLRGQRRCYALADKAEAPYVVGCPSTVEHKPSWERE